MSYLTFLLVFLTPPLLLLAFLQSRPLAGLGGPRARYTLPLICLLAFVYTTPWDNYLVYRGVWSYGPDRVLAAIGYVPVEEYAFFLVQPLLTGLFLYVLLGRRPVRQTTRRHSARRWGGLLYASTTLLGVALLLSGWNQGLYLGLILAWASPILLGMWLYAGSFIWSLRRTFLLSVAVPTLYLWIADRTAISLGIWDISNQYSLDLDPLGLPVEEAVFFFVTNLLVAQGSLLFLFGDEIARAQRSAPPEVAATPNEFGRSGES